MNSPFYKRLGVVIIGVAIIIGTFIVGDHYGSAQALSVPDATQNLLNKTTGESGTVDFSLFWKAWNILNEKYVPTHSTTIPDDQEKVYGAIEGLTASLGDPYTVFFPPQEAKDFQTQIAGNFEGIGMEVGVKDGILIVTAPLKGSPAEKAGIKAGDKILKIGTTTTDSISPDDAVNLIRGPKGTSVTLTLLGVNDQQTRTVTVVRQQIDIPTINTKKLQNGIFEIQLYSFSENAATLFRGALQEFVSSGDSKLIVDLRGNPGGYLDGAVDMASWFLPAKDIVVKEDSAGHGTDETYYSKGYNIFNTANNKNFQMIILVDNGSASAAEILSGALQQNGVAKLVGTQTFGKGSVQELINLTSDTSLKVTVARWLTPNGSWISQKGLTPDYVVPITQDEITAGKDPQTDKAIELLGGTPQ